MSLFSRNANQNIRDRFPNLRDWENDFSSFASLLFDYIGTPRYENYITEYDDIVELYNYVESKYPYCDRLSKLSFQDLKVNKLSTFNFLYCDKYLIDLKFLDVVEDLIKRSGPISSNKLEKLIGNMTRLRANNLKDQFDEFILHHKPIVNEVASKVIKPSYNDTIYHRSFKSRLYSDELEELFTKRSTLYRKMQDDIKKFVLSTVKFDTANRDVSSIRKDAQLQFLRLARELVEFDVPFDFKWNGIYITSACEDKASIQEDGYVSGAKMSLVKELVQVEIREMEMLTN